MPTFNNARFDIGARNDVETLLEPILESILKSFYVIVLCLVGRFLMERYIHAQIMIERMSKVWRLGRGVLIMETNKGANIFQFHHKLDMQRVLKGGI